MTEVHFSERTLKGGGKRKSGCWLAGGKALGNGKRVRGGCIKSGRHVAVMEEPKRAQQSFH